MTEKLRAGVPEEVKGEPRTKEELLRTKAKEKGISTKELARDIGVHPSTIRRAFRDLANARARVGLGIMVEILGGSSEYHDEDVNRQIAENWRKFNELPWASKS